MLPVRADDLGAAGSDDGGAVDGPVDDELVARHGVRDLMVGVVEQEDPLVLVVPTAEELQIAHEALGVVGGG